MKEKLLKLLKNAYAPYSNFLVASIAIDEKGNEYKGVNVESATYGATTCAERVAIHTAITNNMQQGNLMEIHLLTYNTKNNKQKWTTPCGICRQVISEQSNSKAKIFIYNYDNDEIEEFNIQKLLPNSFGKDDLIV